MGKLSLLDCTLRDGGYINDWRFGEKAIQDMSELLAQIGVDILELGFIKNEPYQKDRTVFNNVDQIKPLIGKKKPGTQYAVMAEVVSPLPLDLLAPADPDGPDIIRVIVWKTRRTQDGQEVDNLQTGFDYCKGIVEKGYKLCVQPARVSQYSDEEFLRMLNLFSQLNPLAIYIVDSWGTMFADRLLHYLKLADENLPVDVAVGYHGHNNMMQAFATACAFAEASKTMKRDMIIDASVYGIGRGAGNLNLENFAMYLNKVFGRNYNLSPVFSIYDKYIQPIYLKEKWGFSLPFFISAKYDCNPNYASYFERRHKLQSQQIERIIASMQPSDRILFSNAKADAYVDTFYDTRIIY